MLLNVMSFHTKGSRLGKRVNNFHLKNTNDSIVALSDFSKTKGFIVIFTCNHCPFAKLYSQRMNDLNAKYKPLGMPVIAINSMDSVVYEEETFKNRVTRATEEKYDFPYLFDTMQTVGRNFDADHTPQAFIVWKEQNDWIVKYSGSVDDNGKEPQNATPFVANAVDQLLKGQNVTLAETESVGCRIFYRK